MRHPHLRKKNAHIARIPVFNERNPHAFHLARAFALAPRFFFSPRKVRGTFTHNNEPTHVEAGNGVTPTRATLVRFTRWWTSRHIASSRLGLIYGVPDTRCTRRWRFYLALALLQSFFSITLYLSSPRTRNYMCIFNFELQYICRFQFDNIFIAIYLSVVFDKFTALPINLILWFIVLKLN